MYVSLQLLNLINEIICNSEKFEFIKETTNKQFFFDK